MGIRIERVRSSIVVVTPPAAPDDLVITVDALKKNCGFASTDTDFDDVFRRLILEATDYVENAARCYLRPFVIDEQFEYFPYGTNPIRLSREPVRSITSVSYKDETGVTQTMDAADYQTWLSHNPPLVSPTGGECWPDTDQNALQAMTVRYAAGPVSVSADYRPTLVNAVMLIATATWNNADGKERHGPLVTPPRALDLIQAGAIKGYE